MEQKEFSWLGDVSRSRLKQDMAHISQWYRYTGSWGGEACVDYILGQLREFGIPCWAESFEFLRSYPIITRLQVEENGVFRPVQALAAVFSASCQDLQGPLWCDEATNGTDLEESRQFSAMRGKIVLTHRRHGEDILKAFHHGALAVISVWDTQEEKLHHNTIGTVWGGPAPENLWRFGSVPAVCVTKREGEKLWQDAAAGRVTRARLTVQMAQKVVTARMPVADIPGQRDSFLLVNGHYDSWYEGVTDNAAANVSQLECARVLWKNRHLLQRGVRLVWWGGHSDGRYAGSAAYADRHYEELRQKCVGQLNQDMFSGLNCQLVGKATGGMEQAGLLKNWIQEAGAACGPILDGLNRSSDESFSGIGLPFSMMSTFTPRPDSEWMPHWPESAGPWWHTVDDDITRLDEEHLVRDAQVMVHMAASLATRRDLPVDMPGFIQKMDRVLAQIDGQSDPCFTLCDVRARLQKLQKAIEPLQTLIDTGALTNSDPLVQTFAGALMRLSYSWGSEYEHDDAYPGPSLFSQLRKAVGLTRENSRPVYFLAVQNRFQRQKNRLLVEIEELCRRAYEWQARWEKEQGGVSL